MMLGNVKILSTLCVTLCNVTFLVVVFHSIFDISRTLKKQNETILLYYMCYYFS